MLTVLLLVGGHLFTSMDTSKSVVRSWLARLIHVYLLYTHQYSFKVAEIGNQVSTDDPIIDSIVNSPNSLSIIVQLQTEIGFSSNLYSPLALLQTLLVPLLCIIRILKEKEGSPLVMLCSHKLSC